MDITKITDSIKYIGVNDKEIDLFEGQYIVPNGISYNSYVILDEKIVVMDTVDASFTNSWLNNLNSVLKGREVDYLVISHMEPDHAANIKVLTEKYPQLQLVGNSKTFQMIPQFFEMDIANRCVTVAEGDTLNVGSHTLQFFMAPMVHWPEVMVTYESLEKVLFSADAFGKFGALDVEEDWTCEARRYYFNIVGKYGVQVQTLLKKVAGLDISMICPLHGPILKEDLGFYLGKYDVWSSYEAEDDGVFIAYASIYGNTANTAKKFAEILITNGANKVSVCDLAREDLAEAIEDAFRYDKMVLAASSYNGDVFPFMAEFLHHLKGNNYKKRKVALIENGSWAPSAGRVMRGVLETMKDISLCENIVTIKSTMKTENIAEMEAMAEELLAK